MSRSFLVKIILFSLPVVVIFIGLPVYAAWYIGEIKPFDVIAREQKLATEPMIYFPDIGGLVAYKRTVMRERQSNILLLGSSRVYMFRDEFCSLDPSIFYNAGIRTLDMETMREFGEIFIDIHRPDVLILGLDQPSFRSGYEQPYPDVPSTIYHPIFDYADALEDVRLDLQELVRSAATIDTQMQRNIFDLSEPIYGHPAAGMYATLRGIGYRDDGSLQVGAYELNLRGASVFSVDESVFDTGDSLNPVAMQDLDYLLNLASENQIEVIAFFPPFAPSAYEAHIEAHRDDWGYLDLAAEAIDNLMQDYGYSFYDFSNPDTIAIEQDMMLDDWHPSQRASLHIFQELVVEHPDLFANCTTPEEITVQLASTDHPRVLFDTIPDGFR